MSSLPLTTSGTLAAAAVGAAAIVAGWRWAVILITYFVASTSISRVGRSRRHAIIDGMVAKTGSRDALQVLANGGAFALAALLFRFSGSTEWIALGIGALAASAADTWATEIGVLSPARPRSILTWRPRAAGTSGAVSLLGTVAAMLGASFVSVCAAAAGWGWPLARAAFVGGVAGAFADSLLGATVQSRRWCASCTTETEQRVHRCGTETTHARGIPYIENDAVNLAATIVGGLVAWIGTR